MFEEAFAVFLLTRDRSATVLVVNTVRHLCIFRHLSMQAPTAVGLWRHCDACMSSKWWRKRAGFTKAAFWHCRMSRNVTSAFSGETQIFCHLKGRTLNIVWFLWLSPLQRDTFPWLPGRTTAWTDGGLWSETECRWKNLIEEVSRSRS